MTRTVYERHTDTLFVAALCRTDFAMLFLNQVLAGRPARIRKVETQTRHAVHSGTIDLDLYLEGGIRFLVENKIDAGYSVTREGAPQPERYAASVAALRARGIQAYSILLAPRVYLTASRFASAFDHAVSYEALRPGLSGADLDLLDAAIAQAEAPYEPEPNDATGDFFAAYTQHASKHWPDLVIKHNPNGNGVRPTGSNTIYFVVHRMLRDWSDVPRPRMSLQCRDSKARNVLAKKPDDPDAKKADCGAWGKQNSHAHHPRAQYVRAERGPQAPRDLTGAFFAPIKGQPWLDVSIAALEKTVADIDRAYGAASDDSVTMRLGGLGTLADIAEFAASSVGPTAAPIAAE